MLSKMKNSASAPKNAVSAISGEKPIEKESVHYFFKLGDFADIVVGCQVIRCANRPSFDRLRLQTAKFKRPQAILGHGKRLP